MSIRDQQRELAAERLGQHLLCTGLAQTSLRELARAAETSDRMLLYYFKDKAEVLSAAIGHVAAQSTAGLDQALPAGHLLPPGELAQRAAMALAGAELRPFMRLWIEMVAAAARGEEPYAGIVAQVMLFFQHWVVVRLAAPPEADPEALARAIIALVDGLALVEIGTAPEDMAATRAALKHLLG